MKEVLALFGFSILLGFGFTLGSGLALYLANIGVIIFSGHGVTTVRQVKSE